MGRSLAGGERMTVSTKGRWRVWAGAAEATYLCFVAAWLLLAASVGVGANEDLQEDPDMHRLDPLCVKRATGRAACGGGPITTAGRSCRAGPDVALLYDGGKGLQEAVGRAGRRGMRANVCAGTGAWKR